MELRVPICGTGSSRGPIGHPAGPWPRFETCANCDYGSGRSFCFDRCPGDSSGVGNALSREDA